MRKRMPLDGARRAERAPDVASMVEDVIGCKWSLRLLGLIADGVQRPSAFQRACPGLSAKVMNERLAKLLRFGIAARSVTGERPPLRVVYTLTPFGRGFVGVLDEVRRLQAKLDEEPSSSTTPPADAPRCVDRRATS